MNEKTTKKLVLSIIFGMIAAVILLRFVSTNVASHVCFILSLFMLFARFGSNYMDRKILGGVENGSSIKVTVPVIASECVHFDKDLHHLTDPEKIVYNTTVAYNGKPYTFQTGFPVLEEVTVYYDRKEDTVYYAARENEANPVVFSDEAVAEGRRTLHWMSSALFAAALLLEFYVKYVPTYIPWLSALWQGSLFIGGYLCLSFEAVLASENPDRTRNVALIVLGVVLLVIWVGTLVMPTLQFIQSGNPWMYGIE